MNEQNFEHEDGSADMAELESTQDGPPFRAVTKPEIISYFGDYELLEEIGHGGMGVVYKARQTSLNRFVAVKMILAGQMAQPEYVERFHREAKSAGQLNHRHIVAVHEVGVHEGHHYFSMDYVAGRSLQDVVHDEPLPSKLAARYLRQVAEAIEYAHQQGVLHRDLKPANILIDGNDQPQVTDFGLARSLEADSELTAASAVVGTPSYMPPEQADPKREELGPWSDVYGIGRHFTPCSPGGPRFEPSRQSPWSPRY